MVNKFNSIEKIRSVMLTIEATLISSESNLQLAIANMNKYCRSKKPEGRKKFAQAVVIRRIEEKFIYELKILQNSLVKKIENFLKHYPEEERIIWWNYYIERKQIPEISKNVGKNVGKIIRKFEKELVRR